MKKMMKGLLGLMAVAAIANGQVKAQESTWKFRAGIGGNVSQISGYLTGDPHFGYRLSGQVLKTFGKSHWGVMSGLEFVNKGENHKSNGAINLNSLQIPLYGSYHFDLNYDNRVYIEAGPYMNYVLSGKDVDTNIFEPSRSESFYNSFGYGLGVSLVYNYRNFIFRVGYEQGLSSVRKESAPWTEKSNTLSEISLGVAWQF